MSGIISALGQLGFYVIWIGAMIVFVLIGIAFLPDGSAYPFPTEITTGIVTLYSWLYSLNALIPVATAAQIFVIGVVVEITTRLVWPLVSWVIKTFTGGGQ